MTLPLDVNFLSDAALRVALSRIMTDATFKRVEVHSPKVKITARDMEQVRRDFDGGTLAAMVGKLPEGTSALFVPPQSGVPRPTIAIALTTIPHLQTDAVQTDLFHELVHYAQFASAQYFGLGIEREINAYISAMLYLRIRFAQVIPAGVESAGVQAIYEEASRLAVKALRKAEITEADATGLREALRKLGYR